MSHGRQFNGNKLQCKTNGFTDLAETDMNVDYSDQKHLVDDFNGRFYHQIHPQPTPLMRLSLSGQQTPAATKRKQITHSESKDSLLQTIEIKNLKAEAVVCKVEPEVDESAQICGILQQIRVESIVKPSIEAPEPPEPVNEECFNANWQRQVICCDCGRAMPWFHIVDHECSRDRPDYLS